MWRFNYADACLRRCEPGRFLSYSSLTLCHSRSLTALLCTAAASASAQAATKPSERR